LNVMNAVGHLPVSPVVGNVSYLENLSGFTLSLSWCHLFWNAANFYIQCWVEKRYAGSTKYWENSYVVLYSIVVCL